jgi:hypothetical protein
MTKHEKIFLVALLKDLSDHYANAACNELFLSDTPHNRELIYNVNQYMHKKDDSFPKDRRISVCDRRNKIVINDICALDYIIEKFKEDNDITEDPIIDKL